MDESKIAIKEEAKKEVKKNKPDRASHVLTLLTGILGFIFACTVFASPLGCVVSIYGIVRICLRYAKDGGISLMEKTGFIFSVIGIPVGIFLTLILFGV